MIFDKKRLFHFAFSLLYVIILFICSIAIKKTILKTIVEITKGKVSPALKR